jgi:hypothetical protein
MFGADESNSELDLDESNGSFRVKLSDRRAEPSGFAHPIAVESPSCRPRQAERATEASVPLESRFGCGTRHQSTISGKVYGTLFQVDISYFAPPASATPARILIPSRIPSSLTLE